MFEYCILHVMWGWGGGGGGDNIISRPKCTWLATVLLTVNPTLYPCTIFDKNKHSQWLIHPLITPWRSYQRQSKDELLMTTSPVKTTPKTTPATLTPVTGQLCSPHYPLFYCVCLVFHNTALTAPFRPLINPALMATCQSVCLWWLFQALNARFMGLCVCWVYFLRNSLGKIYCFTFWSESYVENSD